MEMRNIKQSKIFFNKTVSVLLCILLAGSSATVAFAADGSTATTEEATELEETSVVVEEPMPDPTEDVIVLPDDTPASPEEDVTLDPEEDIASSPSTDETLSSPAEELIPTEEVPAEEAPIDEDETQNDIETYITSWTWVDEEAFLTEYGGSWFLGLPGLDVAEVSSEELEVILTDLLPHQISATLLDEDQLHEDVNPEETDQLAHEEQAEEGALSEELEQTNTIDQSSSNDEAVLVDQLDSVSDQENADQADVIEDDLADQVDTVAPSDDFELINEMQQTDTAAQLNDAVDEGNSNPQEDGNLVEGVNQGDSEQQSNEEQPDGALGSDEFQAEDNAQSEGSAQSEDSGQPEDSGQLEDSAQSEDGAQPEQSEEALVDITWDLSALTEEADVFEGPEGEAYIVYRLRAILPEGYTLTEEAPVLEVWLDAGGAEAYANYPGTRTPIASEKDLEEALIEHRVHGIQPDGVTVNLFDYDPEIGRDDNDLLPDGAKFENYSNGINEDALLLFGGSAMREAGFWNLGSGAGRPWGKANTNMKGIVKSTLVDGYPYINLEHARDELSNPTKPIVEADGNWGDPNRQQMDIANLNHAELTDAGVGEARALSEKLLNARGLAVTPDADGKETVSGPCEKASLQYLFDPDKSTEGKRSYKNITGLFQVDESGYYYYDARKNFAEFKKADTTSTTKDGMPSDGSFTLYDGPAVWRTDGGYNSVTDTFDGDNSLGNFFPFDSASKVFDCIQTKDKAGNTTNILSSSEKITNVGNAVRANHYMGMTVQADFTQPEDGKLSMGVAGKQPMVFQFSGDDDVWIFVDDVLVLDIGAVHSELCGTIDFSTGEVLIGQSWRTNGLPEDPKNMPGVKDETTLYRLFVDALGQQEADARGWATSSNGNKIFRTGSTHTLKMFYLERGNYDSSLQMRFNLQPSLYQGIKKVDQNGDPLAGVVFDLYKAKKTSNKADTEYTEDIADYETVGDKIGSLETGEDGKVSFARSDGSPFSFIDQYHTDGTLTYILKETKTAGGYRLLPNDIVLRFNPDSSMLVVANRYQTGAYASFFSSIRETGTLTYGQFDTGQGNIAASNTSVGQDSKQKGIIVAVPMMLEKSMSLDTDEQTGKWIALYGSNTDGLGAVVPASRTAKDWRKAVLKAALYQASNERWPEWRLTYNEDTGKLEGLLEDLPGRADRYVLSNPNGDMKMVYGIIEPRALANLNITGDTSAKLYDALEAYVSRAVADGANVGKNVDMVIDEIVNKLNTDDADFGDRDFSFLNTDQFQREFRSTIYIPNERRELRVQKVDEDGRGVNGVEFTLTGPDGNTVTGTTATVDGLDGMLIFRPDAPTKDGYAQIAWAEVNSTYTLQETKVPAGYVLNETKIPVVVGIYSIYADAGTKDDGVTVMAGVGKLMQTMTKYAADDLVNITLRDITAFAQKQSSGSFSLNGWKDDVLVGTTIPRSMNLHYGKNAIVDYGLHNEDGGQNIYPFFTTDEGFLRARVEQNTDALEANKYEGSSNTANWDNLSERDLTSLFSLLNTVVVTNKKTAPKNTGKLRISKVVAGDKVQGSDYTHNFTFKVSLKNADGTSLAGAYYYYGEQRAGYISNGGTLSLRHDEALTVLGLPTGTKWEIEEQLNDQENGWSVVPSSRTLSGDIATDEIALAAFTNYKGTLPPNPDPGIDPDPTPRTGSLTVSKTVTGDQGDTTKDFTFTVTLSDTTVQGVYGDMTFQNGVATFTLSHGQSVLATGLPAGINYTVEEADNEEYTVTATGDTGTIAANITATAAFINHKGDEEVDLIDVTVNKVWKLDDDGTAADSVTIVLYGDNEEYARVILNASNNWAYTWTELSSETTWTVAEVDIPEGFTASIVQDGMNFTITNDDNPAVPDEPVEPIDPAYPVDPDSPDDPVTPEGPASPEEPFDPNGPTGPDEPTGHLGPGGPGDPTSPNAPTGPQGPTGPTAAPQAPSAILSQTGDSAPLVLLLAVCAITGVVAVALIVNGRRKKQ